MIETLKPIKWTTEFGVAKTVTNEEHWAEVVRILEEEDVVFVDTETTGLLPDRRCRLIQVAAVEGTVWAINPHDDPDIITVLMESEAIFVAHNAIFDLLTIAIEAVSRMGVEDITEGYEWIISKALKGQVYCTMAFDQVKKSRQKRRGLATCAKEQGVHNKYEQMWNDDAAKKGLTDNNKYEATPLNDKCYLQYAIHDIFQLRAVYKSQERHRAKVVNDLIDDEQIMHVLYGILHHQGLPLDFEKAEILKDDLYRRRARGRQVLKQVGINKEGSTVQVRDALLAHGANLTVTTEKGALSTAKKVLEKIEKPPMAQKISKVVLLTRSASKDMSMVDNFAYNSYNGMLHPDLESIGTVTYRSACGVPNLQQVNKHEGDPRMRGCIVALPGYVIASCDVRGMEIATIADLTGDKKLIKHYMEGFDIHGNIALQIYGDTYTPKERNYSKQGVFAMLYGAGVTTMAEAAKCSIAEAKAIKKTWRETYTVCTQVSDAWMNKVNANGYISTPWGWRPNVGRTKKGQIAKYRAVNYMVQGMAAWIFKQSAIQIARAGLWPLARMVVHDEFVLMLPEGTAEQQLAAVMQAATYRSKQITYETEGTIHGSHWGTT